MVGAKCLLTDGQRSLVEQLGISIAALSSVQLCQIVQHRGDVGMIGTKRFLTHSQRPLVERLGVGVTALTTVKSSQVVQRLSDIGMIWAERHLGNCQEPLLQWYGVRVSSRVFEFIDFLDECLSFSRRLGRDRLH